MRKQFNIEITKKEYRKFVKPKIEVPKNVNRIKVSIDYEKNDNCVIDLGIYDTEGLRGYSGGARSEFYISIEHATPGYQPGDIKAGDWSLLLFPYKVDENGFIVKVTIEFKFNERMWLKGETHSHTLHSDGSYSIDGAINKCLTLGYDYLTLSDHNQWTQNCNLPSDRGIIMIPGCEFTTVKGHANLLGVRKAIDDFEWATQEDVYNYFKIAKDRGAYVGINHPFCEYCGWEFEIKLDEIDWIEIINGGPQKRNYNAINWWHEKLCDGYQISVIGGSDTHREDKYVNYGIPVNYALVTCPTQKDLLDAFKKGNCYISIFDIKCDMRTDNNEMGELTYDNTIYYKFENTKPGDEILFISDKGVIEKIDISKTSVEGKINIDTNMFVRVELKRYVEELGEVSTLLVTNPFYNKRRI